MCFLWIKYFRLVNISQKAIVIVKFVASISFVVSAADFASYINKVNRHVCGYLETTQMRQIENE